MKYLLIFSIALSLTLGALAAQTQKQSTPAKASAMKSKPKRTPAKTAATKPKPKTTTAKAATTKPKPKPTPAKSDPAAEKVKLDEAIAAPTAAERAAVLQKFVKDFPKSEHISRARESLVVAHAALADEKLQSGEIENGVALFKHAVEEAPVPIPDRLFTGIIATFPANLFYRGQRDAAFDIADLIEKRIETSAPQLLGLANFYIGIENGAEAMRLAEAAAKINPNSAAAYQTMGLAHRLNFDLDQSATSYAKALELDPESAPAKRSLAEMKRALGKPDEAAALYTDLLTKNESDIPARTGLIISLFDAGKRAEAEAEMARSLEKNPSNVILLASSAYWYAANDDGAKAVELGQKAVDMEPRYIWSHIALARGLMKQNKPVGAERVLIKAREYGNFPTLEYEIASARFAAGFYRDAAEGLQKSFALKDGMVRANLGGRVLREDKNFADLVAFERRASIFEPASAESPETAAKLKLLFDLNDKLNAPAPNEAQLVAVVDEFISGSDRMKFHRQLYTASALLQKNVAIPLVLELAKSATGNADDALDVPSPNSAAMASELYDSRSLAFSRGEFLTVPEVPRQTLSAILRGRIEEIAGWALYQQNSFADAQIRLRRAISVLPDQSAWWRSAMWRLGAALAADGKDKEALTSYLKSYKTDKPDFGKYVIVESLYKKVNGNIEGLETEIGRDRMLVLRTVATEKPVETPASPPTANKPEPEATPVLIPSSIPAAETPQKEPTTEPVKQPVEKVVETVAKTDAVAVPEPTPQATPAIDEPKPEPPKTNTAIPSLQINVPESAPKAEPTPEIKIETKTDTEPAAESKPAKSKALFEPIIITIPSPASRKPVTVAEEKPTEPITQGKKAESEPKADSEPKTDDSKPAEPESKPETETAASGAARPRVVDGKEIKLEETPVCTIGVSQESISLINNGGSVGILVSLEGEGDIKDLAGVSSSPKDVEVVLQPEIGGVSGRRFFVIKSVSTDLGVYQVTFAANCGKKEVIVNIR
jgi:tetratricopeptide (TPR) repeat protein/predicted  nucleic acid-binding Zn-ribbon protein